MNPDQPSAWQLRSDLDRLRNDHESLYREFQRVQRRVDENEKDIRALLVIPVEVRNLTASMDKLSERLETITSAAASSQKWAWQQFIAVAGLIGMIATVVFTIARAAH